MHKPSRKQLAAAWKWGLALPKDADRFQVQRLLSEHIKKGEAEGLQVLTQHGITDSSVIFYEDKEWIVIGEPSARRTRLCPVNGGERMLARLLRKNNGELVVSARPVFVSPEGYMHPFSLEADECLVNRAVLGAVARLLSEALTDGDRITTPYGPYWKRDTVRQVLERYFSALTQTVEAVQASVPKDRIKKASVTTYCPACGDQLLSATALERRCQSCRDDGVRVEARRHCTSCGQIFTAKPGATSRWQCTPHSSEEPSV